MQVKGLRLTRPYSDSVHHEEIFYTERLIAASLAPIVPEPADRTEIHRIIYEELCRNIVLVESEATYVKIATRLVECGADCLILGCTEVGMLLNQGNLTTPVFDTTLVHCDAALTYALSNSRERR